MISDLDSIKVPVVRLLRRWDLVRNMVMNCWNHSNRVYLFGAVKGDQDRSY